MLSSKKLQEIIKWAPKSGQIEVEKCKARDMVICAGRRWGKSSICAFIALKAFLRGLDDIKQGKTDSVKIWIVAPSYDLTQKVFEYFVKWFIRVYPDGHQFISNRPFPQVKLAEGVWLQCRSTENPTSMLGEELDLTIVDEAAIVPRRVYERYIFPTTSSRKGRTIFISTPFGQNWFYEQYQKAKLNNAAFHFRSIDGVSITREEWNRAKDKLPEQVFNQEYEASFLPDAAAVFRGVNEIIKDNCLQDAIPSHQYVMGVDLGKHEDFTVITVIDKWNNNVVYWDRFKDIDYPFQKKRIKAVADRYKARVYIDSTGVGEPIYDDLRREGIFIDDYKFTNKSKKELIEKLSINIEQKYIFIPPKTVLRDELESFGYKLTDSGNITYSAPQGLHDDCVISLALAVWGIRGKARPTSLLQEEVNKNVRKRGFQFD